MRQRHALVDRGDDLYEKSTAARNGAIHAPTSLWPSYASHLNACVYGYFSQKGGNDDTASGAIR